MHCTSRGKIFGGHGLYFSLSNHATIDGNALLPCGSGMLVLLLIDESGGMAASQIDLPGARMMAIRVCL